MGVRPPGSRTRAQVPAARRAQSPPSPSDELPESIHVNGRGPSSVRWSAAAVIGRQAAQMLAALVLARILGPQTYGIISAATVYVTLTTLVLDQGLAAAIVQRPRLTRAMPGAVATANLLTAAVLAAVTWFSAPLTASFFHAPRLAPLLQLLGVGLLLKGLAITPRAMQQRRLHFGRIAVADIAGGAVGAIVGIAAAVSGADIWSMAAQVLTTDLVIAAVLIAVTRDAAPNLQVAQLRSILPFSLRIFGSNGLAFFARNSDNILVGRYLGLDSLSLYSMAYRVLVIPVQMVGQTVNRVTFPMFARLAKDRDRLAASTLKVTELLAFVTVLPMIGVAVGAREGIECVLGSSWAGAAPILTVLAVSGARETIFSVTATLMRATGAGKLLLRYEVLATTVQLLGIIIGLRFGPFGVAAGLTCAGFALVPVMLTIQRRLCGVSSLEQLRRIAPPVHASLWGCLAYLVLRWLLGPSPWLTLTVGAVAYLAVALVVLTVFHRSAGRRVLSSVREIMRPRSAPSTTPSDLSASTPSEVAR